MSISNLFAVVPAVVMACLAFALVLLRKVQYPSPLVWGQMLNKIGPVRAHEVLGYNEKLESEEDLNWRGRRESRRQQFKVNWGYLSVQTKNTTAFLQALRFEKLKIKSSKPGLKYERVEVAIVALIEEANELRWEQVRWQFILQLRDKLGLKVDKETFNNLLVRYKFFEENMVALARAEGQWLYDMLVERLGLTAWGVIEGGQSDYDPA
jgi:hypothetical protein